MGGRLKTSIFFSSYTLLGVIDRKELLLQPEPKKVGERTMVNLGVLVSGSGSNLQAIIDHIVAGRLDAKIKIVISNIPGVLALERARKHGIPFMVLPHKGYRREDLIVRWRRP